MASAADLFTRANAGTLGGSWAVPTGQVTFTLNGNAAREDAGGDPCAGVYTTTTPATDDHESSVILESFGADLDAGPGAAARMATGASTMYKAIANTNASGRFQLRKVVAGTETGLGGYTGAAPVATDELTCRCDGDQISLRVNDVERRLVTDTSIASGGWGVAGLVVNTIGFLASWEATDLVTATLEQEGFRWRNDDGSETTATWAAAQDVDLSAPIETPKRLRILVNATGDVGSTQYQLEYRIAAGTWRKVEP